MGGDDWRLEKRGLCIEDGTGFIWRAVRLMRRKSKISAEIASDQSSQKSDQLRHGRQHT